jgi:hypothetical protein
MTEDQIKRMVDRFLQWKLPEDFHPDNGISFDPTFNKHLPVPMKCNPVGTNLLTAAQAEAMIRHLVEGLPGEAWDSDLTAREKALINAAWEIHKAAGPREQSEGAVR